MSTRRHVLFGSLAAAMIRNGRAAPARKILVVLIDGFGPEYLERSDMPNLKRICREGGFKTGRSVIPSVTDVNNASLVTACFPSEHGITSNYWRDRTTGASYELDSAEFLLRPTIFERVKKQGLRTALVSSKDKVRRLCSRGADIQLSAEKPTTEYVQKVGRAENIYSAEANYWSLRAARHILKHESVGLMYLSTTDYMMHTYPPEAAPSLEHLHTLDRLLAGIVDDHPRLELYLTADHGMNAKTEAIDPARILKENSITAVGIPIIRDEHVVHHGNLGGAYYLLLDRQSDLPRATQILRARQGVEAVFDAPAASRLFHLYPQRIGDLLLLGTKDTAFGELEHIQEETKVRSHGSRHEARVPLVVYGRKVDMSAYEYNLDLTRRLFEDGIL
jgi:phosphonoacetate hydrolase